MINNFIGKIRRKVSIYSKNKTTNLFDGSYKSVYQGNGMDFENLREYIPGDNIRDIDWKATARGNRILVKQYVAEKKHNIMLVWDTGRKMTADTKGKQVKKNIALHAGGIVGYLGAINGNNVGAIYNRNGLIQYYELRTGLLNMERILTEFDREKFDKYDASLEKSLSYINRYINRRMIVFIITDETGLASISEDTIKKLSYQHDVLFISISDANLTENNTYSVERGMYVPEFVTKNKKLKALEKKNKEELEEANEKLLNKYGIVRTIISTEEEVMDRITELLGGHKYANSRQ